MKAIVCVKQVPDTSGKVAVKADGTLDRASMATITNPDDLNALEAALKLKDATGCEVVVVTMGPPPAEGMLRELLARGADIESRILHEKPVDPIIYDEDIDEDDPEGELAALAPFADGFAFACSLWPELMKSQNKAIQAALVGILRHESPDEEDAEEEAEADDATAEVRFANLDEALEDVEACVQEIAEVTRKDDIKKAPAKKPVFAKKRR